MSYLNIKKLPITEEDKKLVDISLDIKDSTKLIIQRGRVKTLTLKSILELLSSNFKSILDILPLFVMHDIHNIKEICKNIVIIKDGTIVEKGKTKEILKKQSNKYTMLLLKSTFENKNFRE